jgi:hypothetical protein
MNVSQTRRVTPMRHVITQKDLSPVDVILNIVVMDLRAMVCFMFNSVT